MSTSAPYGISVNASSPIFARLTDPQQMLMQWVVNCLQTTLAFYWSAPEVGASLTTLAVKGLTATQLANVPSDVQNALQTDQRIASVQVVATTTYTATGDAALALAITVTPKDPNVGPFSFSAVASSAVANIVVAGLGSP